ncbi:hypothetical protein RRG08_066982 [Elysia crispata]|uniref:Uncharacterized protein n=1 Tax=Elysia crispata TaxID=231223 RepID=A0AAE1DCZ9_9GAST|nr:hypothetical protein RRG08_066982 [Elysia crispata]
MKFFNKAASHSPRYYNGSNLSPIITRIKTTFSVSEIVLCYPAVTEQVRIDPIVLDTGARTSSAQVKLRHSSRKPLAECNASDGHTSVSLPVRQSREGGTEWHAGTGPLADDLSRQQQTISWRCGRKQRSAKSVETVTSAVGGRNPERQMPTSKGWSELYRIGADIWS